MVDKLNLPFPILSDPDRSLSIEPYRLLNTEDPRGLAIPATVVIDPNVLTGTGEKVALFGDLSR